MFREEARDFATAELAPKVMDMERAPEMASALTGQLFEHGQMGIEVPESNGCTGAAPYAGSPGAPRRPAAAPTRFALQRRAARPDGGDWVLIGQKSWITNGAEAGPFIAFATVDPDAGYSRITAFLVAPDFEGLSVPRWLDSLQGQLNHPRDRRSEGAFVAGGEAGREVGVGGAGRKPCVRKLAQRGRLKRRR